DHAAVALHRGLPRVGAAEAGVDESVQGVGGRDARGADAAALERAGVVLDSVVRLHGALQRDAGRWGGGAAGGGGRAAAAQGGVGAADELADGGGDGDARGDVAEAAAGGAVGGRSAGAIRGYSRR